MTCDELILKYRTFVFNEFIKCCQLLNIDEHIHFTDTLQRILPLIYQDESNPLIWTEIEQEFYKKYRHKMRFFSTSGFINFFFRSSEQMQVFLKKQMEEAGGDTVQAYDEFLIAFYSLLEDVKIFLYLADPGSTGLSKASVSTLINS